MYYILLFTSVGAVVSFFIGFKKGKLGFYYRLGGSFRRFALWQETELYIKGIPLTILLILIAIYSVFKINYNTNHYVATIITIIMSIIMGWWLYTITPQSYEEYHKDEKSLFSNRTLKVILLTTLGFILFILFMFAVALGSEIAPRHELNLYDQMSKITQNIRGLF